MVYVPNAYDAIWEPWATEVEYVENGLYYCEVRQRNFSSFNAADDVVVRGFKDVFEDIKSCQDYINLYYYDGYCRGCKYRADSGTILNCSMCVYNVKVKSDNITEYDKGVCDITNVPVWSARNPCIGAEICMYFSPSLSQYEDWTWERYRDLLKYCEFNKECLHHKNSAHKTCDYDKYLDEFIKIPVDDDKIEYLYIRRREWIDHSFVNEHGDYLYHGVRFKPEYTKTGKIKKGTLNRSEFYDEVKIWKLSN